MPQPNNEIDQTWDGKRLSIIIPARNEKNGLDTFLPELRRQFPMAEILVVDDGSTDATAEAAASHGAIAISHPYGKGNGAAIKTGVRAATGNIIALMDADGQHRPDDLNNLLNSFKEGYDLVVGARNLGSQANLARGLANGFYNRLASWMVEQPVLDLTSGMRVVDAKKFKQFLYLLPNGFSYPTTITMAFFRAGYSIAYVPIDVKKRIGESHIRPLKDGFRFLLIIFKIGTLYSPLKLFTPVSLLLFFIATCYYGYTFFNFSRFTNMSALLYISSVSTFMIGLVSEQITTLMYKDEESQ